MGQTVLLIQFALEDGKLLVKALLEQPDFDLIAAFWKYDDNHDKWFLFIATPILDNISTHEAYKRIIETMNAMKSELEWLESSDIYAKSPNDPLIKALCNEYPHHSKGKFIRGESWGGYYVEEAYLYYVA